MVLRKKLFFLGIGTSVVVMLVLVACVVIFNTEQNPQQQKNVSIFVNDKKNQNPTDDVKQSKADGSVKQQDKQLKQKVKKLTAAYDDKVQVSVVSLDGQDKFSINGDVSFVSASMIKLLILSEYLHQLDEGTVSSQETIRVKQADIVGGTGVIQYSSKRVYSYDDLARLMIAESDNTATNILIDVLGMNRINARAKELDLRATSLERKMMSFQKGVENHISANDAARILVKIYTNELASKKSCERAQYYLKQQADTEGLIQGIPRGVTFGHKTGSLDSIRHDGGIVYGKHPYVIVVLTKLNAQEANALMSKISKMVYNTLEEK